MKIFKIVITLGLIISFLSCNELNNKTKIGFLDGDNSNERARNTQVNFQQRAEQLGFEAICKDARNNEIEQFNQAMELIEQGVRVIVIKPVNSVMAAKIVRIANEKGVKVIANDQLIRNCMLDYYISFDSRKVGEYIALEALAKKPKGTYVLFYGDKIDINADLVKSGMLKILQPQIDNGNINILYANYIEAWSLENAENEMEMIMRLTNNDVKIDAVLTSYDGLARGAIKVLKKYNLLENTFIGGQNAEVESLKMILKNEQSMTVFKSAKVLGTQLAELAAKLSSSITDDEKLGINATTFNGYKDVKTISFNPVVVNSSNLEKVMAEEGIKINDLN